MQLKVNAEQWQELGEAERQKIESIISGFFHDATIVADLATPRVAEIQAFDLSSPFCKAACDIVEAAAVAACASLANPIAIAACIAAAHAAGDECRRRC